MDKHSIITALITAAWLWWYPWKKTWEDYKKADTRNTLAILTAIPLMIWFAWSLVASFVELI
jgi:hypothetical protein